MMLLVLSCQEKFNSVSWEIYYYKLLSNNSKIVYLKVQICHASMKKNEVSWLDLFANLHYVGY